MKARKPAGRPPLTGERLVRMQVNVERETHDALAIAAEARRTTVSGLARQIFTDWLARADSAGKE